MSKTIKLKDKVKKKDLDAFMVLLPIIKDYMNEIMPVYLAASAGHKIYLREHNSLLDAILRLMEGN